MSRLSSVLLVLALPLVGCTQQAGRTTIAPVGRTSPSGACSASELELALRFIASAASGEMRANYALFNKGTRECTLSGFDSSPNVRLIDAHGVPLSVSFSTRPLSAALGTAAEPSRRVTPGNTVFFDLFWRSRPGDPTCRPARELRLSLPNSGGVLTASAIDATGAQPQAIEPCDGRAELDVFHGSA